MPMLNCWTSTTTIAKTNVRSMAPISIHASTLVPIFLLLAVPFPLIMISSLDYSLSCISAVADSKLKGDLPAVPDDDEIDSITNLMRIAHLNNITGIFYFNTVH